MGCKLLNTFSSHHCPTWKNLHLITSGRERGQNYPHKQLRNDSPLLLKGSNESQTYNNELCCCNILVRWFMVFSWCWLKHMWVKVFTLVGCQFPSLFSWESRFGFWGSFFCLYPLTFLRCGPLPHRSGSIWVNKKKKTNNQKRSPLSFKVTSQSVSFSYFFFGVLWWVIYIFHTIFLLLLRLAGGKKWNALHFVWNLFIIHMFILIFKILFQNYKKISMELKIGSWY